LLHGSLGYILAKAINNTFPMKILLPCILVFLSNFSFAQFAIIHDKDGYCNIRSSAGIDPKIIDKLENEHLVYRLEQDGNWANIDYTKNKKELNGYVYYDRLKFISDYPSIPFHNEGSNSVTYSKDSIKVIISQQKFDRNRYKLSFNGEAKDQVELVNGKQYWGTDGEVPKREYQSIIVYIGQRKITLPKTALANLFEPSLNHTVVNYDKANDVLYIQSANSDGAGFYEVIWKIEKGIYKERFIAYGF
jgi:hypothetical protein